MKRQTRFLLIISVVAVIGIIALQMVWLSDYFTIHKEKFNALTQTAVQKALEAERSFRNDSIESAVAIGASDTSRIRICSRWLSKYKLFQHLLISQPADHDTFYYSHSDVNFTAGRSGEADYIKVAKAFAKFYRLDNIEKNRIYYTPEAIGFFADSVVKNYPFDSAAFCRFLKLQLEKENIDTHFSIRLIREDKPSAPPSVSWFSQLASEVTSVNTNSSRIVYIQVLFGIPYLYVLQKMLALLISSLLLILVTCYCFYKILRSLYQEKKLSVVKNDFISNITHEFKTPIATVTAALEALEDFGAYHKAEKRSKYFKTARQEINRLSDMVNKILNISIYEKKDIEIKKAWLDPREVIEEIIANYQMIETKKIVWSLNAQTDLRLKADRELLHIALSNVIDNAIKYSADPVKICISITKVDNAVCFMIKDNGIGMSDEETAFVFEKFYRAKSHVREKVKGYGLGLSYTKSILDAHKGRGVIESQLGKGTEFCLLFPVQ